MVTKATAKQIIPTELFSKENNLTDEMIESYKVLEEKCNILIQKIKRRKNGKKKS